MTRQKYIIPTKDRQCTKLAVHYPPFIKQLNINHGKETVNFFINSTKMAGRL
jgi:hypothetical protein